MLSLDEIWQQIERNPRAEFLVGPESRYQYRDLSELIQRLVAHFDALDVSSGDRILIATRNEFLACSTFIAAMLALGAPLAAVMAVWLAPPARFSSGCGIRRPVS